MWVVIPVKPFMFAKQRLSAVLTDNERAGLARVMLCDLLKTISQCNAVSGIVLISQEQSVTALAKPYGATVLDEEMRGLSRAVTQAAQFLAARGQTRMLMLPGDVPLSSAEEIDTVIAAHTESVQMTIVSDREGFGTNAIAVSPLDLIPFQFGRESFQAHCRAAVEVRAKIQVLKQPGLAFDIDTPDDLRALMTYDTEAETLVYLCDRGVIDRIMPRANSLAAW